MPEHTDTYGRTVTEVPLPGDLIKYVVSIDGAEQLTVTQRASVPLATVMHVINSMAPAPVDEQGA